MSQVNLESYINRKKKQINKKINRKFRKSSKSRLQGLKLDKLVHVKGKRDEEERAEGEGIRKRKGTIYFFCIQLSIKSVTIDYC